MLELVKITQVPLMEEAQGTKLEELKRRQESHKCRTGNRGGRGEGSSDRTPHSGRVCSEHVKALVRLIE